MHFSLRGYDEIELRSLSVGELRLLCCERELIKPSEKYPQAGTCVLRLLQWKKERSMAPVAPLSYCLIEDEHELQIRFGEMKSDEIRKLCEDRGIEASYHTSTCVVDLFKFRAQEIFKRAEYDRVSQLELEQTLLRARELQAAHIPSSPKMLRSQDKRMASCLSTDLCFRSGDVVQIRMETSGHTAWWGGTVKNLSRNCQTINVTFHENGGIEEFNIDALNFKNCRIVDMAHVSIIPMRAPRPYDFVRTRGRFVDPQKVLITQRKKSAIKIIGWYRTLRSRRVKRLVTAVILVQSIARRYLAEKKVQPLLQLATSASILLQKIVRGYLMRCFVTKVKVLRLASGRLYDKNVHHIVAQLKLAQVLVDAVRMNIESILREKSFPIDILLNVAFPSGDGDTIPPQSARQLVDEISRLSNAAGKLSGVLFREHYKKSDQTEYNDLFSGSVAASERQDIRQHNEAHSRIRALDPIRSFIGGATARSIAALEKHRPLVYFMENCFSSLYSHGQSPLAFSWLSNKCNRLPWTLQQSIHEETGIIPSPFTIHVHAIETSAELSKTAAILGTVPAVDGAIALTCDADNFQRQFSGHILQMTTVYEKQVVVLQSDFPKVFNFSSMQPIPLLL